MSGLHDNELVSYVVDFKKKRIVFNTEYDIDDEIEQTIVIFTNVTAHFFKNAGEMANIIFDIECNDVKNFIDEQKELLQAYKNYGWPVCDYENEQELLQILMSNNQKYYVISSSCGMWGFVIAENMSIETTYPKRSE